MNLDKDKQQCIAEQDAREMNMFGCMVSQLDNSMKYAKEGGTSKDRFVMSLLSDSQELITQRRIDKANHVINRAKYCLDAWDEV